MLYFDGRFPDRIFRLSSTYKPLYRAATCSYIIDEAGMFCVSIHTIAIVIISDTTMANKEPSVRNGRRSVGKALRVHQRPCYCILVSMSRPSARDLLRDTRPIHIVCAYLHLRLDIIIHVIMIVTIESS